MVVITPADYAMAAAALDMQAAQYRAWAEQDRYSTRPTARDDYLRNYKQYEACKRAASKFRSKV